VKTTGRVCSSSVQVLEHEYVLSHVMPRDIEWGMRTEWRAEVRLQFADQARTVVDILDAPRLGGGIRHVAEILATYLEEHDPATLIEYGDRLGNRAVFKRLGHIIEATGHGHDDLIEACLSRQSAGISALDPDGPPGGRRYMRWGLRVNVELGPEEPA
jgi:predicted transcriptional regulator of viral defense system